MPLEPYYYRPATPPQEPNASPLSNHSRNTSGSSVWSRHGSPSHSVETRASTPSRSPLRQYGPTLLPKIRTQEQTLEAPSVVRTHRRAHSTSVQPPPTQSSSSRPGYQRSTTSPPEYISLLSPPVSATSNLDPWQTVDQSSTYYSNNLTRPSIHARSVSASRVNGHSRTSSSSTVIDDAALRRYGYPTYRNYPTYRTASSNYAPSHIPGQSTFIQPPITIPQQTAPALPSYLQYANDDDPGMTVSEYFTSPNPAVHLCPELKYYSGNGKQSHFWWDIRNLRTWEDFSLKTINRIPLLPRLLDVPVPTTALPEPQISQSRLDPASESQLFDVCRDYYTTKVNAALKISSLTADGRNCVSMRAQSYSSDGPHFISNYQSDFEQTFYGNGRGRVVGVVKSYHRWNTGMRHEVGQKKVLYLAGLAHLQRHMREHSCRYGFILTEIELVCVRAGTEPPDQAPYFGFLELSSAIRTGTTQGLTACMGLWYLNMLAKDSSFPGQHSWKVDVGPPAALTRMKILEPKDEWIPTTQKGETRNAKTVRGWVNPSDPYHRQKEGGKLKRVH